MAVGVNGKKRIFTIRTKQTTYQMMADAHGPRAEGEMDYLLTYYDRGFSGNPGDTGNERSYSLDALPQEYPQTGTGDYRSPALTVEGADGYTGCDLRYQGYTLGKGMPALPGLPAVYADGAEAETLTVAAGAGYHHPERGDPEYGDGGTQSKEGAGGKPRSSRGPV